VQTVYSIIGQRDNKLNIETATAARRDSNDMRIIAAVTLVFLPGTFTATLFSTTFFNFQNQTSSIVSWWLWLYFVVTVGLTLVVLVGWYYISKRQDRTMLQSLNVGAVGKAPAKADEEAAIFSEKESLRPESDGESCVSPLERRVSSIGRIAAVGSYTMNDLDARMLMSGVPTEWHGHH
jgi:hypothetical protein